MREHLELKLASHKERLNSYQEMLSKMPEDTLLGRICILSYIKREEKKILDIQLKLKELKD